MRTKEIREYIAAQIGTIEGIGQVHSSNKLPKTDDEFEAWFEYDGRFQAWIVTRGGIGSAPKNSNFLRIPQTFTVTTFLGYSLETESEERFEDAVNTVYKMFSNDATLGGLVAEVTGVGVPEMTLVKVAGVVKSHYAEITIDVIEFDR